MFKYLKNILGFNDYCKKCGGKVFSPKSIIENKEIKDYMKCDNCGEEIFVNAESIPYNKEELQNS